jgi:hypothetical protein
MSPDAGLNSYLSRMVNGRTVVNPRHAEQIVHFGLRRDEFPEVREGRDGRDPEGSEAPRCRLLRPRPHTAPMTSHRFTIRAPFWLD